MNLQKFHDLSGALKEGASVSSLLEDSSLALFIFSILEVTNILKTP